MTKQDKMSEILIDKQSHEDKVETIVQQYSIFSTRNIKEEAVHSFCNYHRQKYERKAGKKERLKFSAAYWVPSAGAEATGGKLFSAEGMHNCDCDLILFTLPEGW